MKKQNDKPVAFIVNASNLHHGGGVQVAASFIGELSRMAQLPNGISVVASTTVTKNIVSAYATTASGLSFSEVNTHGLKSFLTNTRLFSGQQKQVLTVFGPLYGAMLGGRCIVGFAQPWIIYPENECYAMLPIWKRIGMRLKFWIQEQFFKRSDLLIVELEHVKQRLIGILGISAERIHVVHNCLSALYFDEAIWQPVDIPDSDNFLKLGFVGRNYIHKNTAIFPAIVNELASRHHLDARFYVTFTENEWAACTPAFRRACINVGPLSAAQCPRFYQSMDAVVFPSLLECFSATPLEAMVMKKPLFASDRPFNRDVCGPHAHYFDPTSPASAAQAIANVFSGVGPDQEGLRAASEHSMSFSNAKERAEKYIALLSGLSPASSSIQVL